VAACGAQRLTTLDKAENYFIKRRLKIPNPQLGGFEIFKTIGGKLSPFTSDDSKFWQGWKESNLRMPESKSGALTNLATPLHGTAA
jgi:hypothetical protein